MARLVSGLLPNVAWRRLRLRLPFRFKVLTLATRTLNTDSTAWRISVLLALGWTTKVYTPSSSRA